MKLRIIVVICSLLLLLSSCGRFSRPAYVNEVIDYINTNKKGNEKVNDIFLYGEKQNQRGILIKYYNVDDTEEANEIISLFNNYLKMNPESELNNDYYIELEMSALKDTYSLNYRATNAKEYHNIKDIHNRITTEDALCRLEITGLSEPSDDFRISRIKDCFLSMRVILFGRRVLLDDNSAFSSHSLLENVYFDMDNQPYQDSEIEKLNQLYPSISFHFD